MWRGGKGQTHKWHFVADSCLLHFSKNSLKYNCSCRKPEETNYHVPQSSKSTTTVHWQVLDGQHSQAMWYLLCPDTQHG
jgi:hypothetical protein